MRFGKTLSAPMIKLVLLSFVAGAFGVVFVGVIASASGRVFLSYIGYIEVAVIALLVAILLRGVFSSIVARDLACARSLINPKSSFGLKLAIAGLAMIASNGFSDLPIFGWDVLDQWSPAALDYLRGDEEWTWANKRSAHPAVISALIALAEKPALVGADIFSSTTLWITA